MQPIKHTKVMRIAIAQLNPIVGDITHNLSIAREAVQAAQKSQADFLIFSELFISGYSPEDLLFRSVFIQECDKALLSLAQMTEGTSLSIIIGCPSKKEQYIYNSAFLLADGKIIDCYNKFDLPTYGEFDEKRFFTQGNGPKVIQHKGLNFAIAICEDVWNSPGLFESFSQQGAQIAFILNGSPYTRDKWQTRQKILYEHSRKGKIPIIYVNQIGGQDSLVYDGGSFAVQSDGSRAIQMKRFVSEIAISEWEKEENNWHCTKGPIEAVPEGESADYNACLLGLQDYVKKNNFKKVLLGLSGGLDSALCAAIAVDALGAENVRAIMLPYNYTTKASLRDAEECANLLGCRYEIMPIGEIFETSLNVLQPFFQDMPWDITEENLQSRSRALLLMALSNKFNEMLLTTGNKSEIAVGYATIYGDMCGGFNPIKDLYKTQVYGLAHWRNKNWEDNFKGPKDIVIPYNILHKAPSAELRENQLDEDSLPPYDVLDDILSCLVEQEMSIEEITQRGYAKELIVKIAKLLYQAEYKRYQAAPGVKLSAKSFDLDRRYPITNHFRH